MNDNEGCGVFFMGLLIGALLAGLIVGFFLEEGWKLESVSKGKAEFILNEKDGTSTWRWKE